MHESENWCVVSATWDGVKTEAYLSHLRLAMYTARQHAGPFDWLCQARKPIAAACTALIAAALKHGAEWVLYLDDDVVPAPDTFCRLRDAADAEARPVVSALATFRAAPYWPSIFEPEGWGDLKSVARPMPVADYPENELIEVFGTGLCATLIHSSVFERLGRPWFNQSEDWTPDGFFALRCQERRIPIHCHTGIQVGHLSTQVATPASYRTWCAAYGGTKKARERAVEHFRIASRPPADETAGEAYAPGSPGWLESLPPAVRELFPTSPA